MLDSLFMKKYLSLAFPLTAVVLAFIIIQSGTREDFFISGASAQQADMRRLFSLLDGQKKPGAEKFTLIREITQRLKAQGETKRINLFLTTYAAQNPDDPYNAYYLFDVAENYRQDGAAPLAVHYYERILNNYNDLVSGEDSLHYLCLKHLIELEEAPSARKRFFEELQHRFNYKMTSADLFYQWGRSYESLGLWDEAISAYNSFLTFPDVTVKGDPKAASRVRSLVDFAKVDRQWIRSDLDGLIADLKKAVLTNNSALLENLRAKVGFFTLSWDNNDVTDSLSEAFDIRVFLRELVRQASYGGTSSVVFDTKLDEKSGENEAYLRASGWNYRIPTWYFYFRRVDYPADPEINGSWEWAGVFFGEKM